MYDYDVLDDPTYITRVVLFCVAVALWLLYFHEILFRSGRVRTGWIKKRAAELGLMLLMALVTILIFSLVNGVHFGHGRR